MTVVGQTLPREPRGTRRVVVIMTETRKVQGMTQGKINVAEREMERCGLAVMAINKHRWLGQVRISTVGETGYGCHTGCLSHCQYLIR